MLIYVLTLRVCFRCAVNEVYGLLNQGYREVVDADLSSYFDTIPHHKLMKSIARRVSDGAMLALIKTWLEMAVEEDDGTNLPWAKATKPCPKAGCGKTARSV